MYAQATDDIRLQFDKHGKKGGFTKVSVLPTKRNNNALTINNLQQHKA